MRLQVVTAFLAGFACGLLLLAVLLWHSGRLQTLKVAAAPGNSRPAIPTAVRKPAPVETAPVETPNIADAALAQRKLTIPVQGVRAQDLRDDFNEVRGGHRHEAIDIMAARGTPVIAADEGNVVKLFHSKPGGLTVYQFDDSRTYCYYYAHLDKYAPGLKEGALLRKGGILGYVGSSGDASPAAPHLHFAIFKLGPEQHWWEGTPIDPYGLLAGIAGE
jgi:murein DD-endopeptidase MepM/ murein hydrolase activator NlpD